MKKNAKNLPEFKALIERYKTITLEEIEKVYALHLSKHQTMEILTGAGSLSTCTLCLAVGTGEWAFPNCWMCVYRTFYGCSEQPTFLAMMSAQNPKTLLAAYRARAAYMETLLK